MIRLVLTSFACLLILTSIAFGQFGYDITGGGARAQAMGNAYIAVSDDITASGWNPAGLLIHEGPMLGLSWGNMAPRGNTLTGDFQWDAAGSFSNITSAGFVAPIRIGGRRFVGSIGYTGNVEEFVNNGRSVQFDTVFTEQISIDGIVSELSYPADIDYDLSSDYHSNLNSVNFAVASRFMKDISFGFAVNIYTGQAISNTNSLTIVDSLIPSDKYPQSLLYGQQIDIIDTVKYSGYNFTIGFKYDGPKLDVGLMIRSPFDLNTTTGRSTYVTATYNDVVQSGQSSVQYEDDLLTKVQMPWFIGTGIAYSVEENFLIAADMEYRKFSGRLLRERYDLEINSSGNIEYFRDYDPLWNDVFTFRLGTEYVLKTNNALFPEVPLRAGFAYVPLPYSGADVYAAYNPPTTEDEEVVAQKSMSSTAVKTVLSAGIGVHWSQIYLDLAYSYSKADLEFDLVPDNAEIQTRDHKLNLSFTGYF